MIPFKTHVLRCELRRFFAVIIYVFLLFYSGDELPSFVTVTNNLLSAATVTSLTDLPLSLVATTEVSAWIPISFWQIIVLFSKSPSEMTTCPLMQALLVWLTRLYNNAKSIPS